MAKIPYGNLRRHLVALLIWTLLCGLFFATILAGSERLPAGDLTGQFHAFGLFQAREMAQGHLPFWSPGSYGGFPFAADTQSAVYYLPRWLTILFSRPWGFPFQALELEAIFHVWLAGVFTYALALAITGEPAAALLAAVAFGLSGYLTAYPILQLAILETVTWLPLVLLLLRIGVGRTRPAPWLIGAGLALAMSALAGHPQTFLHVSYVAAAYYLFLAVRARWSWRWIVGLGAMIAIAAIGTSAAALLPALHFVPHTVRQEVGYQFVATGLPLLDYVQILVPGTLSFWSPEYAGLATIVLVALAIRSRCHAQHAEVLFWGMAALAAAWLALGDSGVLFALVYRLVPGFSLFQRQERLLSVFSFSLALLAAQGLAAWLHADGPQRLDLVRRPALAIGCLLALAGLILAVTLARGDLAWRGVWLRQWLVLAITLALLWTGRYRHQQAWALAILLGVDLYISTLGAVNRQPSLPGNLWPQPQWLAALRSASPSRLDSQYLFTANIGEVYGLEDVRGISPLKPQSLEAMEQVLPNTRRWQLLNVTHVLSSIPPAETPLTPVAKITESLVPDVPVKATLYRFDDALPRAWMSYRPVLVPDAPAALKLLADPAFDPANNVVLHTAVQGAEAVSAPPAGEAPPRVQVTRSRPDTLQIQATTQTPGLLVISEWYFAGWQATLDGQPVPLYPADYALQALLVPAGEHQVVLRFAPKWEIAGLLISLVTLALAGALAWRWHPAVALRPAGAAKPAAAPLAQSQASPIPWLWLGIGVILLGFALRAFRLGYQELRGDEAFSYLFAVCPFTEILPRLLRQGDPHSPFHYWLLHLWMQLAGRSEFSMRYISLIPGILLLPLIFQLGRRLRGRRLGLLAAGLAALSQSQVWVSQDARNQYTLAMLFATLAILLLAAAIERGSWWRWALYALACALGVYAHYYTLFALLPHVFCMLAVPAWRKRFWSWVGSIAVAVMAFAPWLLAMWPNLAQAGQLSDPSRPSLARYLTTVGSELAAGSAFPQAWARWLFVLGLLLCILGSRRLMQRQPAWAAALLLWLGGTALGIFLLLFTRSTFNPFYIIVASPAWWALVGMGVLALWEHGEQLPRTLAAMSLAALVLGNGASLQRNYFDPAYSRSNGYRGIAAHIAAKARPGDVFVRNLPDPCFDYYMEDIPLERLMQPTQQGAGEEQVGPLLAELAEKYDRLWFVPANGPAWDSQGAVRSWLDYHTLPEQEATYNGLSLLAYRPLHAAGQVMAPLNQPLDGVLRLDGAFVTVNGAPADLKGSLLTIPPGAAVKVTLLWESLAKTEKSYTVFVHLMSEDGKLLTQHDGIPTFGTSPTQAWQPGDRLLDRHDITMPADIAAGKGFILVGMYDSKTLERQAFAGGRDAIRLADVQFAAR